MIGRLIWKVIKRMLGVLLFIVVVFAVNLMDLFINSVAFDSAVRFLNGNIGIIIAMSLIFLAGEVFALFRFPFNLPTPIFKAVGSIYVITFVLNTINFLDFMIKGTASDVLKGIGFMAYPIVFLVVLIVGYINIFSKGLAKKPQQHQHQTIRHHRVQARRKKKR
ncbi:hypothetical protein COV93_05010 [Candidatus Woesearchaeota archaeon CG11_big_fil_rev_8_21_14_0_20_43_8]|nr:MAG: hypothetical protein COV93_05010 [Candidatus Woesearchaeota archaeon CG11_big_fil_rev_8_21_14_0_20_43_8]PIO04629.1 MAG: hypothetical protein COT47_08195 [Candidatus Woesearchaeota archaeon CG08_land_8_20_14_0_20_43_7]